ncbi:MAG: periplasmic heavy metal sensor [Verrucomicrobia bacterium]|nr:periplasmic heavy metal sensor [Verrucomicrobiota bacterium]
MKRAAIIILCGAALGGLAGVGVYFARTAPERAMLCCAQPELAWLQHKFQLTDAQFARVRQSHTDYLVHCAELCARIAATNELIRAQIATVTVVTPETEKLLASAAQLRVECQTRMLDECFAVSREMSPEQGRRYLAWVQQQIFTMPHEPAAENSSHSAHGN